MTAQWQPGKTYIPGSIVVPTAAQAPAVVAIINGDFETGDLTGWLPDTPAKWSVGGANPYQGSKNAINSGGGVDTLHSTVRATVTPGLTITASCMVDLNNVGGHADNGGRILLVWFDSSGAQIHYDPGNLISGAGNIWQRSSVTASAPPGAVTASVALSGGSGSSGGSAGFDAVTWSYSYSGPPAGLVYKATQSGPGVSAATEPAWPGNTTTPVTDNTVTWEGIYATQLVWTAVPINKSGGTEPTWPTSPGGTVHDGSIDWVAKTPTVDDPNCPHSKIVAIAASKVYAADNDIVRYSSTVNPLDWSSANDAGYLPFGLQLYGDNPALAMGLYRSNLVIFSASGFQMWQVDEDPANTTLLDALPIASTQHRAMAPVANDLLFLASKGVRSVGVSATGVNLESGDVGMPIDPLVQASLADALAQGNTPLATFIPAEAQYWLSFANYPPALALTGDLPNGVIGTVVNYAYTASGGAAPYTFSLLSGSLPAGLSLSSAGVITGTETTAGSYSWTVRVTDTTGATLDHPDSATVAPMSLTGSVPNGQIGDVVDAHYTATGGKTPYTYTLLSGSLPAGLTMGTDGHVTGTYTTAAVTDYTVKATDAYGNTATLPQEVTVSTPLIGGHWAALNTTDLQLWLSDDPLSWSNGPYALSATTPLGTAVGPEYDGTAIAFPGSTGNNALIIANQAQISPLTSAAVNAQNPGYRIKAVGGLLFKYGSSTTSGYAYSADHGATWTQVDRVDLLSMHGIARLNTGRWLAQLTHNAGQTFQYSDQAIPTTWTPATVTVAGSFMDFLECDGVTALSPNNIGVLYKTTDGATWTQMAGGFPQAYGGGTEVGRCIGLGSFLFPGHEGDGKFWVSHDSGVTWTHHTRVSGNDGYLIGISAHGSTVVLCWASGVVGKMGLDVSHDGGDTWAAATLPWGSPDIRYPLCTYLG